MASVRFFLVTFAITCGYSAEMRVCTLCTFNHDLPRGRPANSLLRACIRIAVLPEFTACIESPEGFQAWEQGDVFLEDIPRILCALHVLGNIGCQKLIHYSSSRHSLVIGAALHFDATINIAHWTGWLSR